MSGSRSNWRNDWTQFVQAVARDFGNGLCDWEVTNKYCDQPVEWVGIVTSMRLEDDPVVKMEMPSTRVDMPDGRYGVIDYLSLEIAPDGIGKWRQVKSEMSVRFRTSIRKGVELIPGLRWSDLGKKKGYLLIGTQTSELVEIVDKAAKK